MTKPRLSLEILEGPDGYREDLAETIARFDLWESRNMKVAPSSEERLAIWDSTQNGGKLSVVLERSHLRK
jgi:hypothetical protein